MKVAIIAALFVTLLGVSQALDKCPDVKFIDNFDSKKFLGKWYGIQTIGIDMPCGSYEIFETDKPNVYRSVLEPANVNVEFTQKGETLAEGYTVSSSLELLNNSNLRIAYTDYDNYAVIVECKNLGGPIYLAVTFGSRTKTLDDALIQKLKTEMTSKYGIDFSEVKVIDQQNC